MKAGLRELILFPYCWILYVRFCVRVTPFILLASVKKRTIIIVKNIVKKTTNFGGFVSDWPFFLQRILIPMAMNDELTWFLSSMTTRGKN